MIKTVHVKKFSRAIAETYLERTPFNIGHTAREHLKTSNTCKNTLKNTKGTLFIKREHSKKNENTQKKNGNTQKKGHSDSKD